MRSLCLLMVLLLLAGCSMSPEQRVEREKALKASVEAFNSNAVNGLWNEIYKVSTGDFKDPDALKDHLTQPWNQDAPLVDGMVASMAWMDDGLAKVKVNWLFQKGSVQSFSSETFVWIWKGGKWRYAGRSLR